MGRLEFGVRDLDIVIPSSVDQARSFLSAQSFQVKYPIRRSNSQQLPPRFPRKHLDPFSTPLSSRTSPLAMICHGCHGHIGGGAHIGSVPGKNHCKFQHSLTCPGGISEDHDWAPCPVGYVPGGMSASGFENTLQHSDFGPMHSSTGIQNQGASQPNFSTPLLAAQVSDQAAGTPHSNGVQNTITPQLNPLALPHHVPLGGQGHQDLLTSQLTQGSAQHLPLHGHVQQDLPTPEQVQGSGLQDGADWDQRLRPRQGINYSEDVAIDLSTADRGQAQAADLRAANQAANQDTANLNSGQDFPFTINDLRGDPLRQNNVAMAIHQIRRDLPSLAAAQSAPPPLVDLPPGLQPRLQSSPYHFEGQQLPGVQPMAPQLRERSAQYQLSGDGLTAPHLNPQYPLQGQQTQPGSQQFSQNQPVRQPLPQGSGQSSNQQQYRPQQPVYQPSSQNQYFDGQSQQGSNQQFIRPQLSVPRPQGGVLGGQYQPVNPQFTRPRISVPRPQGGVLLCWSSTNLGLSTTATTVYDSV